MSYIGKEPTVGNFQKCDAISVVNGQASYTLQVSGTNVVPESVNHMLVSLNGILQAPTDSFTVSGSTLTFASNLSTGDVIDFVMILGNVLDLGVPSDATVTNAKTNFVSTSSAAGLQIKGDGTTDGTLQLNCSQNSHGIKLKSPSHASAQSYTLTFPTTSPATDKFLKTDSSGNLSFADAGGGKVLQVVQTADNTEATSTSTFQKLSTSITPSATSSKVLVLAQVSYYSTNDHAYGKLRRGGSDLWVGTGASGVNITVGALDNNNYGGNSNTPTGSSIISYLDSPNSTSAQTYDFSMSGDTSFTIYWNKAASGKYVMTSSMTLIEIGA